MKLLKSYLEPSSRKLAPDKEKNVPKYVIFDKYKRKIKCIL